MYESFEMLHNIFKHIVQSSIRIDRFTLTNTIKMINYRSGRRLIRQKPLLQEHKYNMYTTISMSMSNRYTYK